MSGPDGTLEYYRLAMAAWRETRTLFGKTFEIDLYETYIGAAPRLVGKLRPLASNPAIAQITYERDAYRNRPRYKTGMRDEG